MPDETKPDNNIDKVSDAKANRVIWDAVCDVDPKYTKPIKDGKVLTSIVPMYLFRQATELWGQIGKGWGFEIMEEGMIFHDNKERPWDALYQMRIKLWYDNGSYESDTAPGTLLDTTYGVNCFRIFEWRGGEYYINPDFYKSTLTGAIVNALSRLGFGGSVRLKEHDTEYTAGVEQESEADKAWGEAIAKRRETTGPEVISDSKDPNYVSDETLIERGTTYLENESRSGSNPAHIRLLLKNISW